MSATTLNPITARDKITPEIFSRLDHIRRTAFRHAKACARAGLHAQRRELERVMLCVDEMRELVQGLDRLPHELADAERARQEVEDQKIQADKVTAEAKAKAEAQAQAKAAAKEA